MALGRRRTQPLTETSTRNILGGKGGQTASKVGNFTVICELIVYKSGLQPGVHENILRDM
jgi:hypothetical protein